MRRPERVVLLIIGALSTHHGSANFFANRMPAVLWIVAVGSFWTFAHRMFYTWHEVRLLEAQRLADERASNVAVENTSSATCEAAIETARGKAREGVNIVSGVSTS
jgi:hypothetical protein